MAPTFPFPHLPPSSSGYSRRKNYFSYSAVFCLNLDQQFSVFYLISRVTENLFDDTSHRARYIVSAIASIPRPFAFFNSYHRPWLSTSVIKPGMRANCVGSIFQLCTLPWLFFQSNKTVGCDVNAASLAIPACLLAVPGTSWCRRNSTLICGLAGSRHGAIERYLKLVPAGSMSLRHQSFCRVWLVGTIFQRYGVVAVAAYQ